MVAILIKHQEEVDETLPTDNHVLFPPVAPSSTSRSRWFCGTLLLSVVFFLCFEGKPWLSSQSLLLRHDRPISNHTNQSPPSLPPENAGPAGPADVVDEDVAAAAAAGDDTTTTTTTSKRTADGKAAVVIVQNDDDDDDDDDEEKQLLATLRQKLRPRPLWVLPESNGTAIVKNQFLHLHHMKTGGTSMDGLLRCGMHRLQQVSPTLNLAYGNIHECGYVNYQRCVTGADVECGRRIQNAGILSYCAPLRDLQTPAFHWNVTTTTETTTAMMTTTAPQANNNNDDDDDSPPPPPLPLRSAVTVLRHPVGRVWSMFRFQTKNCYNCQPLLEIYRDLDAGNSTLTATCRMQLLNHQTRNLLADAATDYPNRAEQAEAAIRNLHQFFTLVGLTDDMTSTAQIVQHVFPWLAEDLDWNVAVQPYYSDSSSSSSLSSPPLPLPTKTTTTTTKCIMGHANASPQNNHCLDHGTKHLPLPDTPDEATAQAILAHNDMDLIVYDAAVQLFAQQKRALGLQ